MQTLINKGIYKILESLYNAKKPLHLREISRKTKLNVSTVSAHLKKLTKNRIITLTKDANLKKFEIKKKIMFSLFDKQKFKNLNRNVYIPLKEFIELMPKQICFIMLFGSASRKQETKNSDIDLLIVLNKFENTSLQNSYTKFIINQFRKTKNQIKASCIYSISLKFVDINEFKQSFDDHLLQEAKQTGFCIYGFEEFYSL